MNAEELVAKYLELTDSELFEALATEMLGAESVGMGGRRRNALRTYGKDAWLNAQRRLVPVLCTPDGESRYDDPEVIVTQGLVSAIGEALDFNFTESAIFVALILKMGLHQFCATHATPTSPQP